MIIFMVVVHIAASLGLVLIILLQAGKGAGLSNMFGGGGSGLFAPSSGGFLTKFTALLAVVFLLTSLFLSLRLTDRWSASLKQRIMETEEKTIPVPSEEE